ncbi:MAG: glycosyltransferase [Fibrobacterales bacterium]
MGTTKPTFSIITVIFNGETTIKQTLDSLLNQSVTDYELIVIDGASTDTTLDIVHSYKPFFGDKIKVISEKDEGIYDAMNKGINLASGTWLFFLNSDDKFYNPDILDKTFNQAKKTDADILYGTVMVKGVHSIFEKGSQVRQTDFYKRMPMCHQSIFFKQSLFLKYGKFNTNFKICADYEILCRFNSVDISMEFMSFVITYYNECGLSKKQILLLNDEKKQIINMYAPYKYRLQQVILSPLIHLKNTLVIKFSDSKFWAFYRSIKYKC